MRYWLMKSEPEAYSIDDLKSEKTDHWDGIRNYQARNMMRDEMQVGDLAFFYHSNCKPPGIAGIMEITKLAYPDFTQFDPESKYYDPKATPEKPRWVMVNVKFKKKFKTLIPLDELKHYPILEDMLVLRKGSRLSITPVEKKQWDFIVNKLVD